MRHFSTVFGRTSTIKGVDATNNRIAAYGTFVSMQTGEDPILHDRVQDFAS